MRKLLLILFAVLLMSSVATVTAFAQESGVGLDISGGILGIFVSIVASVLVAFGLANSVAGKKMAKIRVDVVDFDEVDKAVETMLGKIGVPKGFADYAGDIIAQVITHGPDFFSKPLMVVVKEMITDEFSRRSAIQAAALLNNMVSPDLLVNRTARAVVAEKIVNTSEVQSLISKKIA